MILSAVNYVALLPCLCIILAGLIAGVIVLSVMLIRAKKFRNVTVETKDKIDENGILSVKNAGLNAENANSSVDGKEEENNKRDIC